MDSASMDQYEKQLYTVFKTFDVDNEESLDKLAVLDLCNALQLEGRGSALVDTLFESPVEKVTFTQFRNGLLSVLGGGDATTASPVQHAHSDDDSSGREVAPKFVYGSKKYGRRSRPHAAVGPAHPHSSPTADSLSKRPRESDMQGGRLDTNLGSCKDTTSLVGNLSESTSGSNSVNSDLDHDKLIDYEESLALCQNLCMDKVDRQMIERIFKEHQSINSRNKMTVGEFFQKLNTSLSVSINLCHNDQVLSNEVILNANFENPDVRMVPMECLVEILEKCGIEHGQHLLQELGFTSPSLSLTEVTGALEEELQISTQERTPMDARALLLPALIALYRLQVSKLKQSEEHITAENIKLKNDLTDANRRAQILAQEVDENHARMESSLKNKIKQLEARHADSMKSVVNEWAAEKEKMSGIITQLENSIICISGEENRLRLENVTLNKQIEHLKRKITEDEERLSELDLIRIRLTKELKSITAQRDEDRSIGTEENTIHSLMSLVESLRLENKALRDRNDELCVEVEKLCRSGREWRRASLSRSAPHSLDISAEQAASWCDEAEGGRPRPIHRDTYEADSSSEGHTSVFTLPPLHHIPENCNASTNFDCTANDSLKILRRLNAIAESLQVSEHCESCNTLKSILTTIREQIYGIERSTDDMQLPTVSKADTTAATQTEDHDEISKLNDELNQTSKRHEEEKLKLSNLVKELEASLEQLKGEYDRSEEYWASKLEEEREVYTEEQRLSDERLTDLITKIGEYERQFAPSGPRLPVIDERYSLELQVQDVEREYADYRTCAERELRDKTDEIERLNERIRALEGNGTLGLPSGANSPVQCPWGRTSKRDGVRDYHNPAYGPADREDVAEPAADEAPAGRGRAEGVPPAMIRCAELEGQLRQQHLQATPVTVQSVGGGCVCAYGPGALERRCAQLLAALRHHQLYLDSVQRTASAEAAALRARVAGAEAAAARLQQRLVAADLLVKELYIENCQLAHHPAAPHHPRALL